MGQKILMLTTTEQRDAVRQYVPSVVFMYVTSYEI